MSIKDYPAEYDEEQVGQALLFKKDDETLEEAVDDYIRAYEA